MVWLISSYDCAIFFTCAFCLVKDLVHANETSFREN